MAFAQAILWSAALKDQLSFYRITPAQLEALPNEDFLLDRDMTGYFERKGTFIHDLWLDRVAIGDILAPLGTIVGGGVDALIGRSGNLLQPSGPTIFSTHLAQGDLKLLIKTLSNARRTLRGAEGDGAERLHKLAEDFGGSSKLAGLIHEIQRFAEKGQNKPEVVSVYVRWGKS